MSRVQQLDALTFPLHGNRLIEASAGTGKTYTLAALYLRLVLGHGQTAPADAAEPNNATAFSHALTPPDILVVTFTRAATAELRDRIRARLVEAADAFRVGSSTDVILNGLLQSYNTAQYPSCAGVLERAAQWMDEAAIFTIHGWCQRMLAEHAFDSGMAFGEQLSDDNQQLLHTLACDYWRRFLYPLTDGQLLGELGNIAKSPEALLADIQPWLQADAVNMQFNANGKPLPAPLSPEQVAAPLAQWQQQMQQLCQQIQPLLQADVLQLLDDAFANSWLNGNKFKAPSWQAERQWWQAQLAEPAQFNAHQAEFAKMVLKYSATNLAAAQKKGQPLVSHALFNQLDAVLELLNAKPQLAINVRQHAALWLAAEFRQRKKQRAELDFNDLLLQLHQALKGEGGAVLAARIRSQYPVAMVDEFQDTDPIQFAIFRAIYPDVSSQTNALIMVGDPKQAIYSFRGADLYTYLQARSLTAGRHYSLSKNFRSTKPLVDAVNQLFNQAELARGAFGFGLADTTPLPFINVAAQGKNTQLQQAGQSVPALNYWRIEANEGELKKGGYQTQMAEACANQITLLLQQAAAGNTGFVNESGKLSALQPSDIAILVRDRHEAALVRQQLSLRNVRSVYLSDNESIFQSAEASAVLYWLRACHQLEDDNLLRAALALPLCANTDGQLQHWLNDELAWEQLTEQIRDFRQIWRQKGVLAMISAWLHYFALPAKWLAQDYGERCLTNVLHLAELLQSESAQRDGETGLIRWLNEQLDKGSANDEQQLRLESDQQLVQVVTIHKSKGLQYNLVFLPFICGFKAAKKDRPQRYFDGEKMILDLTPDDAALEQAERGRLLEDIRLLYVALTRPVYACWLGLAVFSEGNSKKSKLAQSALGYLLNLPPDCTNADLTAALAGLPWQQQVMPAAHAGLVSAPLQQLTPALRLSTPLRRERWWIASYSALRTEGAMASTTDMPSALAADTALDNLLQEESTEPLLHSEQQQSMHDFPRGAVPGTFLHQLLEDAQQQGFAHCDATFISGLLQQHLTRYNWQPWQPVLQPWLVQMLQVPLTGINQSLAQLQTVRAELEFWLQTEQVNVRKLDHYISQAILPGVPRPALLPDTLNGMLKGFIDLTLQAKDQRYWVLDYKSNWLGTNNSDYNLENMQQALLARRYDVQAALYMLALHRLLKLRQPGYLAAPERSFGGAFYWFVRAPEQGQLQLTAPFALLQQLDKLFSGQPVTDDANAN
ncbi:exodeoxyribonuclease V subunit beta [Rheinheimera sp. D18]|uniref:exodeoxyribonuclease V subunit beta n=1 Tax=Rheinheimera sp. D18 TaxID=2545632 RepID=UPI001053745E|nr:exodeoxyribonuclease V subunit beta [Rheinheimera sp. D18]QBL10458.1 exodeoxyribonuclease V subunit beta [Rheinheimera sp. D18]